MPKEVPKTMLQGISTMLKPYLGDVPTERLHIAITTCKSDTMGLNALAKYAGVSKPTMAKRLAEAGVEPLRRGGKSGNEFIYNTDAAMAVIKLEEER